MKRMRQLVHSPLQYLTLGALSLGLTGCGGPAAQVVDLNKVLDVMVATLTASGDNAVEQGADASNEQVGGFIVQYAMDLNAAPLLEEGKTVGIGMTESGSFLGFQDGDPGADELQLFTVEIDEIDENTVRLIATDLQGGYQRDSSPMSRIGTGLLTGMLISSMLNRRSAAGISKSKYRGKQMSPKNYHTAAKSKAKAKARSRAGSRSLKFGK